MVKTVLFLLVLIIIIALIWGSSALTIIRRRHLKNKPFPLHWVTILKRNIPLYKRLPESLRRPLHGHINIFLAEKQFIGCGGLQITDEIKLTIAAQACLLLLNERGNYYPKLYSILVYPSAFIVNKTTPLGDHYLEGKQVVSGESWGRSGLVVFSWDHVKRDAMDEKNGQNVVLHEFAHQLDQEGGSAEGVPILEQTSAYVTWARVLGKEYKKLQREVERGLKTVIDEYGATDPAEFFAVATETFFEKPKQMKMLHPALYNELKRYYKLDPVEWIWGG
ncbi:MAG: zinc-dependent peptidase [Xenococcaceae cyanobacterium]